MKSKASAEARLVPAVDGSAIVFNLGLIAKERLMDHEYIPVGPLSRVVDMLIKRQIAFMPQPFDNCPFGQDDVGVPEDALECIAELLPCRFRPRLWPLRLDGLNHVQVNIALAP